MSVTVEGPPPVANDDKTGLLAGPGKGVPAGRGMPLGAGAGECIILLWGRKRMEEEAIYMLRLALETESGGETGSRCSGGSARSAMSSGRYSEIARGEGWEETSIRRDPAMIAISGDP